MYLGVGHSQGIAKGSGEIDSWTRCAQSRQFQGPSETELVDPGVGRSQGIERDRLADLSCVAEVVFRDRARWSLWILASGVAEGSGETDSWTRQA